MIILSPISSINIYAQGFTETTSINTITVTQTSGEKPQSKVWKYNNDWWAVIASSSGTHIYRLVGTTWTQGVEISTNDNSQADCKVVGGITYILLYFEASGSTSFALIKVTHSGNAYTVNSSTPITLESGVETATIDIDSQGRMWLAYAATTQIYVRWSDSPYTTWNTTNRHQLNSANVNNDDICSVTAFDDDDTGEKIGILWSNQSTSPDKFFFAYHNDTDGETTWTVETATSGSQIADDHINFAVDSRDGTIYAAIKTSKDSNGEVLIVLLVRSSGGTWQTIDVREREGGSEVPTRPIALLDEPNNEIFVIYTQFTGESEIRYKSSSISSISFSPSSNGSQLIAGSWNNATSTKQSFTSEVVILASTSSTWTGVIAGTDPVPVELSSFNAIVMNDNVILNWRTETEVNNYGFDIERSSSSQFGGEWAAGTSWETMGFVEGHGNSNSPKQYSFIDTEIEQSGKYYYRLKQIDNDGTFEYSDVVNVEVGVPNNFYLSQNYPNPFNPTTRIDFTLPEKQIVLLRVYNTLGELVNELINEEREAGSYSVIFDASNMPSGVYFYIISAGKFISSKKMSLIK